MTTNNSRLLAQLQQWRDRMPPEVRLVFDHDDCYEKIIDCAEQLAGQPRNLQRGAAEQLAWAKQLDGLVEQLDHMDDRIPDWQGPAREAFNDALDHLSQQARSLADVGREGSIILSAADEGWQAGDELVLELVGTSVDFAQRTLTVARRMAPLTGGLAMSTWVTVNIRQVRELVSQVEQATERLGSLREHLTGLLTELTQASQQISDDMVALRDRIGPISQG